MTEYEKLLKLYSKECQYAGAMRYILGELEKELALIDHRPEPGPAAMILAMNLKRSMEALKEQYE